MKFKNATGVHNIPEFWELNGPYRVLDHNGQTKKQCPRLTLEGVTECAQILDDMKRKHSCFQASCWKQVSQLTDELISSIVSYGQFLELQRDIVQANHFPDTSSATSGANLRIIEHTKRRTDMVLCVSS